MKIAIVHASDRGGGAERSVVSLHQSLLNEGHQSTLFVGTKLTDLQGCSQIPYVRGIPGFRRLARAVEKSRGWQDIYNPSFRALADLIPSDTDVVHFNSLWGSSGFADLSALPSVTAKFPALITLRESWLLTGHCACFFTCDRWKDGCGKCPDLKRAPAVERDGTRFNWKRKKSLLQKSRVRVIAISNWLRQRAKESPILKEKTVETVYNGINLHVFRPQNDARLSKRTELGFGPEDIVMLVAGQAVEGIREGIAQQWVDAVNQIQDPRLVVMIVGHSAERVASNVNVRTVCVPFQKTPSEMAECFRAADFTTVTSEFEAFGRVAAESQASGTPVVSFATGGLPEIVIQGKTGLVVPTGDVEQLRTAIIRMLDDVDGRLAMAAEGRQHCAEHFCESRIVSQYTDQYRAEIEARSGGAES